jgi:hypothetical protein
MTHWEYILLAVGGPAGLATWRYAPRAFLMIVGGLTKDPLRSKQCERMLALSRKDAKEILKSLTYSSEEESPSAAIDQVGADISLRSIVPEVPLSRPRQLTHSIRLHIARLIGPKRDSRPPQPILPAP